MIISNRWKQYFQSLASNKDVNTNLATFASDSVCELNADFPAKILRAFIQDTNSVILAKAPSSSKIVLYSSIIKSRWFPIKTQIQDFRTQRFWTGRRHGHLR